jgi:aryl-alcohol dehydrogenase-like predicted oxidoreductase
MRYSRLGRSGLVVSKLAFGTSTMGASTGRLAAISQINDDTADRLVAAALDAGVNYFDTADYYHYGQAEEILGSALKTRRDNVVISTKVGRRMNSDLLESGLSSRHIHRSIDRSLRRLSTDWVDLYVCHRADPLTPLEETLAALDAVVRSGKARYIGISNWPAWLAAKAVAIQRANGWASFVNAQMYYSLIARDIENEFVDFAQDAGIGITAWSPLSSGFLSGKYSREDPGGAGGRLATLDIMPFDHERGYTIVDVVKALAAERGVPPAAIALAWVMERPAVSGAILGFANDRQLEANLAAADLVLTADERAALDAVSAPALLYPHAFQASHGRDLPVEEALAGATVA